MKRDTSSMGVHSHIVGLPDVDVDPPLLVPIKALYRRVGAAYAEAWVPLRNEERINLKRENRECGWLGEFAINLALRALPIAAPCVCGGIFDFMHTDIQPPDFLFYPGDSEKAFTVGVKSKRHRDMLRWTERRAELRYKDNPYIDYSDCKTDHLPDYLIGCSVKTDAQLEDTEMYKRYSAHLGYLTLPDLNVLAGHFLTSTVAVWGAITKEDLTKFLVSTNRKSGGTKSAYYSLPLTMFKPEVLSRIFERVCGRPVDFNSIMDTLDR